MEKPLLAITYERLDQWVHSLQSALAGEGFQCALGVLRGGGTLALMVSHTVGIPVAFLRYERATRAVTWDSSLPVPPAGAKVLVCEDLAGAGDTLVDCVEFLRARGLVVKTLTAGFDDLSRIHPDYGIDGRGYFLIFPWERHAYTDGYRERWTCTAAGRRGDIGEDHEFQAMGIDLDGILLPDLPPDRYNANLECALHERDELLPFITLPPFDISQIKGVVTGRPETDRIRTETWLMTHGFGSFPLVMRNPDICDDSASCVAAYKAQAALRLGCTHFVESDPIQAIEIAQNAPLLHVIWWNTAAGEGRLVTSDDWRGTRKSCDDDPAGGAQTTKVLRKV
jgi:hypoxanthine phosphoribosyltransferase